MAKKGQILAFSILKSTPPQKKYTTVGCGGCDKYELCPHPHTVPGGGAISLMAAAYNVKIIVSEPKN